MLPFTVNSIQFFAIATIFVFAARHLPERQAKALQSMCFTITVAFGVFLLSEHLKRLINKTYQLDLFTPEGTVLAVIIASALLAFWSIAIQTRKAESKDLSTKRIKSKFSLIAWLLILGMVAKIIMTVIAQNEALFVTV